MTPKMWTRWLALAALSLMPTLALAADPDYDKEAGKALFEVAMNRMRQGKVDEACQKLEESVLLYAGTGTLFHLGNCYEKLGRTASAWKQFKLVAERARADGQEARQKEAERRAAALEPNLAKVIVSVSNDARASGLELRLDDRVLSPDEWNVPLIEDEGKHGLQVRAPGRQTWQHLVIVKPAPDVVTVKVPLLAPAIDYNAAPATGKAVDPALLPPAPDEDARPSSRILVGASMIGGGVLATGAGAVLTMLAAGDYQDALGTSKIGDKSNTASAESSGDDKLKVGLSLAVIGLASAAIGGVIIASDTWSDPPKTGWVAPTVGRDGGGLAAGGTF